MRVCPGAECAQNATDQNLSGSFTVQQVTSSPGYPTYGSIPLTFTETDADTGLTLSGCLITTFD